MIVAVQNDFLPFICPQDCSMQENHFPLYAKSVHLLSAISLDKPVPSCISRIKIQRK
jgi:hypothetical protein